MNFGELQAEVFRRREESDSSPLFGRIVDVKEAINDAYEELSETTEWFETNQSINKTTDNYYDLSTLLTRWPLTVTSVWNPQTNRWLCPSDVRDFDEAYSQWENSRGEPEHFTVRGGWWLGTYPKLSGAAGTLKVFHTATPPLLSADSDTPGFPQEFHLALVVYALYELFCQEGELKKALGYWKEYQGYESALKRYVQARVSIDRVGVMGA